MIGTLSSTPSVFSKPLMNDEFDEYRESLFFCGLSISLYICNSDTQISIGTETVSDLNNLPRLDCYETIKTQAVVLSKLVHFLQYGVEATLIETPEDCQSASRSAARLRRECGLSTRGLNKTASPPKIEGDTLYFYTQKGTSIKKIAFNINNSKFEELL